MANEVLLAETVRQYNKRQLRLKLTGIGSFLVLIAIVVAVFVFASQLTIHTTVAAIVGIVVTILSTFLCWSALIKE